MLCRYFSRDETQSLTYAPSPLQHTHSPRTRQATLRDLRRQGIPVDPFLFVSPLQSASKADLVEVPSWQRAQFGERRIEVAYRVRSERSNPNRPKVCWILHTP